MIAEINNKISSKGSNLSDRLEDQLTGDVFGTIRYLPAEIGLRRLLSRVRFPSSNMQDRWQTHVGHLCEYNTAFHFWPSHSEGEIDLLLKHEDVLIGIEVKYFSSLSSEDEDIEVTVDPEQSQNQLARYARMLANIGGSRPKYLIFLAPLDVLTQVETTMERRSIIKSDVALGYLSWQEMLESVEEVDLDPLESWQKLIIQDIKKLLIKKHFIRFRGFVTGVEALELKEDAYEYRSTTPMAKLEWPQTNIKEEQAYVYNRGNR